MMAGAACGTILPPYTVYKAGELYTSWIENGVEGAGYNRSSSGWMETRIFADWFEKIILPYFKKLDGMKALIGDNCSSHISYHVVKLCLDNNIKFILLPPNTTHLTQPLDVAFFRPIKIEWRAVLNRWKANHRGNLQKDCFPKLLAEVYDNLGLISESSSGRKKLVNCSRNDARLARGMVNMQSGFRACGIYPLNAEEVLKKIERRKPLIPLNDVSPELWVDSLKSYLDEKRRNETAHFTRGRKKIHLSPGKGIVPSDLGGSSDPEDDSENVDDDLESRFVGQENRKPMVKKRKNATSKGGAASAAAVLEQAPPLISEAGVLTRNRKRKL